MLVLQLRRAGAATARSRACAAHRRHRCASAASEFTALEYKMWQAGADSYASGFGPLTAQVCGGASKSRTRSVHPLRPRLLVRVTKLSVCGARHTLSVKCRRDTHTYTRTHTHTLTHTHTHTLTHTSLRSHSTCSLSPQAAPTLLAGAGVRAGCRVLDVATGPGYVAELAATANAKVVALDFSEEMCRLAKDRIHPPHQV